MKNYTKDILHYIETSPRCRQAEVIKDLQAFYEKSGINVSVLELVKNIGLLVSREQVSTYFPNEHYDLDRTFWIPIIEEGDAII